MRKIKIPEKTRKFLCRAVLIALCLAIIIAAPTMAAAQRNSAVAEDDAMTVLTLWQIDSFEGGRGSRSTYLQGLADEFSKQTGCYVTVTSLSASAARLNIAEGARPDLISYGAGTYGIESLICGNTAYYTWCRGGYCLLSVSEGADFSDCTAENTVINGGTDNLAGAAALLCGLDGSAVEKPTGAYVKLINGQYKYLLGTQRDIFRLKTRGVAFTVKPLTQFNDLYHNISITCSGAVKTSFAHKFINFILAESEGVSKLGLFYDGVKLYDDELSQMEGLEYALKLVAPVSESVRRELEAAVANSDENKLKTLLK